MKIRVFIDQQTALREGVDAPNSSAMIDVDPAELEQRERDLLACLLTNGHDTTESRLCRNSDDLHAATWGDSLSVATADMAGLRRGIAELLGRHDKRVAERKAEQLARQEKCDASIRKAIAESATKTVHCYLTSDGQLKESSFPYVYSVELELLRSAAPWTEGASDEAKSELAEHQQRVATERQRIVDEARPEMQRLRKAFDAERAAVNAEHDTLYARLPELLRQRDADGLASSLEIAHAMTLLAIADAGYEPPRWPLDDEDCQEPLNAIPDAEYLRLREVRAGAPDGAEVTAMLVWRQEWRPATEECEGLADEDGEVAERVDETAVALVTWKVGHLEIRAAVPLS
jgi:hypothetical protein